MLFPPEYTPHGVKMKYDGVPVDLTAEQEEVATMYAAMLETDYVKQKKPMFMKNFWDEFKTILGKGHKIKSLEKCDFRDIYDHLMKEREAKKALSKEVPVFPGVTMCADLASRLSQLKYTPCHTGKAEVEGGERNCRSAI